MQKNTLWCYIHVCQCYTCDDVNVTKNKNKKSHTHAHSHEQIKNQFSCYVYRQIDLVCLQQCTFLMYIICISLIYITYHRLWLCIHIHVCMYIIVQYIEASQQMWCMWYAYHRYICYIILNPLVYTIVVSMVVSSSNGGMQKHRGVTHIYI